MRITWEVGQKVLCVRKDWGHKWIIEGVSVCGQLEGVTYPVYGEIYTIRHILLLSNELCIRLVEIVNPEMHFRDGWGECGWRVFEEKEGVPPLSFEVVRERKTDISIFETLLTPTPELVK